MKLTVTQGNYAYFGPSDWILEGPLSVTTSSRTRRVVSWQSGGTDLRATMAWNARTQVVGSFTIQFRGDNGTWYNWLSASNVGVTYTALTRNSTSALARADVINFSRSTNDNDLYGGGASDIIYGGSRNDILDGGTGNDRLYGGRGNDEILGGRGADRLVGGAGADGFMYDSIRDRGDVITDFRVGSDRLGFRRAAFGNLERGALAANRFENRARLGGASNATVRFVFNQAQHALYYDADGRGGRAPVKIATLAGVNTLSARSIFLA